MKIRNYGRVEKHLEEIKDETYAPENQYNELSYGALAELCFEDMILCNALLDYEKFPSVYDNATDLYDEENDEYIDIYQAYIVSNPYFEDLIEKSNMIMTYCDELDVNVLLVDHFGTSWRMITSGLSLDYDDTENK